MPYERVKIEVVLRFDSAMFPRNQSFFQLTVEPLLSPSSRVGHWKAEDNTVEAAKLD